jgi:hypothetical protein
MAKRFDSERILKLANDQYPDSFILEQDKTLNADEDLTQLLAKFVAATVKDLYGSDSSDNANLERIAAAFEQSAATPDNIARALRKNQRA